MKKLNITSLADDAPSDSFNFFPKRVEFKAEFVWVFILEKSRIIKLIILAELSKGD
jgi:hypothetical protein